MWYYITVFLTEIVCSILHVKFARAKFTLIAIEKFKLSELKKTEETIKMSTLLTSNINYISKNIH